MLPRRECLRYLCTTSSCVCHCFVRASSYRLLCGCYYCFVSRFCHVCAFANTTCYCVLLLLRHSAAACGLQFDLMTCKIDLFSCVCYWFVVLTGPSMSSFLLGENRTNLRVYVYNLECSTYLQCL
jgi:hypothetical protein